MLHALFTRFYLATTIFFFCTTTSQAATYTWTATANGNWNTTGSWSGGTVPPTPGSTDDVINFNANITANVTVTQNMGGTITAGTLTFQDASTASNDWTLAGTGA